MAAVVLAMMICAVLAAAACVYQKPAHFPIFLLIAGLFIFGEEVGGGMNLSALWLLVLAGLAVVALFRLPNRRVPLSIPEKAYMVFLAWAALGAVRAPALTYSVRMFIKLAYPLLAMMLARRAVLSGQAPDLRQAIKWVVVASFCGFLLVGGFTQRFLPWICWTAASFIWACAAFADHLAIMGVVALAAWRVWGGKWYLAYAVAAGLSPVLAGIRTGIGAFVLGVSVLVLLSYRKAVSLPLLAGIVFLGAASILFVPSVKAHMFHDADSVDSADALRNPTGISLDNVNNSGREMLWTMVLGELWEPSPLTGSGLGSVQHFMYSQTVTVIKAVHNSYVELLSDTGLIGLGLWLLAVACCLREAWLALRRDGRPTTRVLALSTLAGFPALMFCMGFDNVVNYALVAGQYPFAFMGLVAGLAQTRPGDEVMQACDNPSVTPGRRRACGRDGSLAPRRQR